MQGHMSLCAKVAILVTLASLMSSACGADQKYPAASSSAAKTSIEKAPSPLGSVNILLKKGMAYADARKILLAKGWTPSKDSSCKKNIGEDEASQKLCGDVPELVAYSAEGEAVMHFGRGGQRLAIWGQGDIGDWKTSGDESNFTISDWQLTNSTP